MNFVPFAWDGVFLCMYEAYAPMYDRIGQAAWSVRMAAWTLDWLQAHHAHITRVADFGCGTGAAARVFAAAGLTVLGVDCSAAMLAQAQPHAGVELISGDIREVVLSPPVDLVTAFYDTLNYLPTYTDLVTAWQRIADAMVVGGYVVVDVNTVTTYAEGWNERDEIISDTDDVFVLNRLQFEALQRIGTGRIMWFVRDGDTWEGHEEVHIQRAHTNEELRQAITQAGLTIVDRRTPANEPPPDDAPRVIYVAQKRG